ncbi:hypothetical protein [Nocardioides sp. R-C-SC26]|uniref:hypothetical protein n=1 Tax=Nocardioides sp. R-C-SC26 TaxID=2870414 RepID=UPI001E4EF550|nr:hypothetical protein [Nocardioides sp. R-C-SC26]
MPEREPDHVDDAAQGEVPDGAPPAEPDWQRRRRLAEIFGEVVPDTTGDERGSSSGGSTSPKEDAGDRWLREQVPPHHG